MKKVYSPTLYECVKHGIKNLFATKHVKVIRQENFIEFLRRRNPNLPEEVWGNAQQKYGK